MLFKKKKVELTEEQQEEIHIKDFLTVYFRQQLNSIPTTILLVTVTVVYGRSRNIRPLRKNLPCSHNLPTETM